MNFMPPDTGRTPPQLSFFTLQALVFGLVAAAISNVYITQPVLPIIESEFGVGHVQASYTYPR